MKKIKKIISLILVFIIVITSTSCGNNKDENKKSIKENTKATKEFNSDIIVVGGGGAGLVSALSAAEKNSNIILLEKQATFGGATSMSSGKIPAVNTKEQKEAGINDSVESMIRDINRAGNYTQNQELLKIASENSTSIKEWLESQGIKWNLEIKSIYYGQSTYRIHVAEGSGSGLVNILEDKINSKNNIIALKNMNVTGLINENGKVKGVVVEKDGQKYNFKSKKVILATSGFGANKEMIKKYTPSIAKGVPNVAPGATGDGILWGLDLGAETAAMNAYQGYAPISFETHKSLGSAFLDNGGILVNRNGDRFINEYIGYSPLATSIINQADSFAYMIWDKNIQELNIPTLKNLQKDELKQADNITDLAEKLGIDKSKLKLEYDRYLEGISKGEDYLNRTKLPKSFEAPFYAVKVTGDYRHTQGGLVINPKTSEVLNSKGDAIENLYAAGGVTEGFSSNGSNGYMAGNGLLQAFVYGRIAGIHSAESIIEKMDSSKFIEQKNELLEISNRKKIKVSNVKYKDGNYKASAKGHGGDIELEVIIKSGKIDNINILSHKETKGISDSAINDLPKIIKESNGTEVDIISGATNSSKAIIEAVEKALKQAK